MYLISAQKILHLFGVILFNDNQLPFFIFIQRPTFQLKINKTSFFFVILMQTYLKIQSSPKIQKNISK